MNANMIFAERIKLLRQNADLTQEEMSVTLNVVQQTVQKWECGNNIPRKSTLLKIANTFNVTTDWLLGLESKKPASSLKKEETDLLEKYWELNDIGREKLFNILEDLLSIPKYKEKRHIFAS